MIIAFIWTPKQLHKLGVKNIYRELLKKRIKAIRSNLLLVDLDKIQENVFMQKRFHKQILRTFATYLCKK
jgi:hypothetical protein